MEDKAMRKTISAIATLGLITLSPVAAQAGASKQENIGVGAGAIIGAAAGGPVGFIVGAAIGAKVGDNFYQKDTEIDSLSVSLEQSRGQVESLERDVSDLDTDIDALSAELARMQRIARPEVVSLLQAGIAMDLLFRTDESVLADTTGMRLNELATTLATMPDIHLQLDGFADERGDEAHNQKLSEQRVAFVRDQLVAAGIDPSRITVAAHGESPAQDESVDSYALERRVSLTLFVDQTPSVAANPN
jgi:outer membrane protein OmpA-like peptidoglycan-associated protein